MTVASSDPSLNVIKESGEKPTDDCKITRSGNHIQLIFGFAGLSTCEHPSTNDLKVITLLRGISWHRSWCPCPIADPLHKK